MQRKFREQGQINWIRQMSKEYLQATLQEAFKSFSNFTLNFRQNKRLLFSVVVQSYVFELRNCNLKLKFLNE